MSEKALAESDCEIIPTFHHFAKLLIFPKYFQKLTKYSINPVWPELFSIKIYKKGSNCHYHVYNW